MSTIAFSEQELKASAGIGLAELAGLEQAFSSTAGEGVVQPAILNLPVGDRGGRLEVKSGFVEGLPRVALKILMGFPDNVKIDLPMWDSMMVLCSTTTGACEAVLMDNSYLTDIRTGLAGAVAAKYLAPTNTKTVGVLGTGTQARLQVRSLQLVRDFDRLLVWGRNPDKVEQYITDMSEHVDCEIVAASSIEAVVKESQVVITATPSMEALIQAEWIHPNLHITAMGSDIPGMQELEPQILERADLVVCDNRTQCFEIGELQHALKAGIFSGDADITELGQVTSKQRPGRENNDQITVCDLTGIGVQDTAIANLAYDRAVEQGFGTSI